jgi:citrate synthase
VLYLLYTGELPDAKIANLIDAVMVASIDHGAGAPSVLAARTAISGGASLGAAGAAGLLTLGKFHGAAVQDAMEVLRLVVAQIDPSSDPSSEHSGFAEAADRIVSEWHQAKRRIPGFGHRQHKRKDPRLERLMGLAQEAEVSGLYLAAAQALEISLHRVLGKTLPINIDGVMAAILCEINFPIGLANALFMTARLTGILAHAQEEQERMPPMRRIDPVDHGYCGPEKRDLFGFDSGA